MKHACRYAIVRFMPYRETGEFANVGIVLMSPTARFFGFRMLGRTVRRVTAFFDQLDPNMLRRARQNFERELTRIQEAVEHSYAGFGLRANEAAYVDTIFDELVRPREAMMYLAEPRAVLADNVADKLQELFDHYVSRAFVKEPPFEKMAERRVQLILRAADLSALYQKMDLGDESYHARFPFVRVVDNRGPIRAIKPINLAHDDATRLYDHGWEWVGRVRKLRRLNLLPEHVLFAAEPPRQDFGLRASAYAEVKEELERSEVCVVDADDKNRILTFAKAA
jgi:hypothetical protein